MAEMMKESNTTWAGLIPDSWQSIIFSYAINDVRTGLNPRDNFELTNDDDYYYVTIRNFKDGKVFLDEKCDRIGKQAFDLIQSRSKLKKGDILFASISDEANACLIEENPKNWNINESVFSIDVKRSLFYPKYLYYLVINPAYYNDLRLDATGSTFHSIKQNKLYRSKLIMPSLNEQRIIANFLDEKCAEIDKLSEDIQKQIDILEEYKKSVITRAVTKGLDPNVEMKKSNMGWVGLIPNNWKSEKIKYHLSRDEKRNPGDEQVLSVYREYGVIPKDSRDDNYNATSEDTSKYKYVKPNQLVINKMKAWQGSMGISEYRGIVSPAYFIYSIFDARIRPRYIHYLLRSCYRDEFRRISGGIREGQWDLPATGFENTNICIPPLDEQDRILDFIESIVSKIDELVVMKREQLNRLFDYKKSFIYEYVTGKKRVKGAI